MKPLWKFNLGSTSQFICIGNLLVDELLCYERVIRLFYFSWRQLLFTGIRRFIWKTRSRFVGNSVYFHAVMDGNTTSRRLIERRVPRQCVYFKQLKFPLFPGGWRYTSNVINDRSNHWISRLHWRRSRRNARVGRDLFIVARWDDSLADCV